MFGPVSLGLYTRASVLLKRPLEQILTPINSVMDPVLSRLQSDPEHYRGTFLTTIRVLAMVIFPFSAMCLVLSRPLVLLILGPKWVEAVPLFSAFALVAISTPLASVTCWLYQTQGRGKDQLRSHAATGLITFCSYIVGLTWGPQGLILTFAFSSAFIMLPTVYYIAGRKGPVSTQDLWVNLLSKLPAWGTFYIATLLARMAVAGSSPIVQLSVCVPAGVLFGSGLLMPFRSFREDARFAINTAKGAILERRNRTVVSARMANEC